MTQPSPQTESGLAVLGRRLFPLRGYFPIPVFLAILCLTRPASLSADVRFWVDSAGWTLLVFGLFMRLWGVAAWYTGDLRLLLRGQRMLRTEGPYVYTRNPRYIGNLGLGLGVTCLSHVPQAPAWYLLVWAVCHIPIVAYEETHLAAQFGETYRAFCHETPRWFSPLRQAPALSGQLLGLNWMCGLDAELDTIASWLTVALLFTSWTKWHLGEQGNVAPWLLISVAIVWLLHTSIRKMLQKTRHDRKAWDD